MVYMKRTKRKYYKILTLLKVVTLLLIIFFIQNSCNKEECFAPIIDYLTFRDSTDQIQYLVPSEIFTVYGDNLKDASVYINNSQINPIYVYTTDTSLTFPMPYLTTNSDTEELTDSILIVKECGSNLMMVDILLAPPYITGISNEYAIAGDTLTLEGYYFSLLEKVIFPESIEGEIVPEYSDTVCKVIVPEGVGESGEIMLYSVSGESSSAIGNNFHDETGLLCNFDDDDTWEGWGGRVIASNNDVRFPATNGLFYAGKLNMIEPGTEDNNHLVLPVSMFEMPEFTGSLSPDYFALKFEIYSLFTWESGYYIIEMGYINDQDETEFAFTYDFQPWSDTTYNGTFSTTQWETFNIPLSDFYLKENSEIPIQSYSQINACNYMLWSFVNPTEDEGGEFIDYFCVGIDNLRIVQEKSEE